MSGLVYNPVPALLGDGAQQANNVYGRQGEQLDADCHGKWYNAAIRKNVFKANVTAKTVVKVGANVASQFTFFNPSGSGVLAEIISTEMGFVNSAGTAHDFGWYYIPATSVALAGSTAATVLVAGTNYFSARVGDTPNAQCITGTAYTFATSTTPVLVDQIASVTATTMTNLSQPYKTYDGSLIIPPGIFMGILTDASAAAAFTASAVDMGITWCEWPFM